MGTGAAKKSLRVFGWHGFFCCALLICFAFAHCAARSAAQKGAPPPFIPCKLFEKSLTKNFTVRAGCAAGAP